MIKDTELQKVEVGLFCWVIIILLGLLMQGCSVKVETQWFGQSEIDRKELSKKN